MDVRGQCKPHSPVPAQLLMTSKCTVRPIPTSNNRRSDELGIRGVAADDPIEISVVPSGQPPISVVSCAHTDMMAFRRPACPRTPARRAMAVPGLCRSLRTVATAEALQSPGGQDRPT